MCVLRHFSISDVTLVASPFDKFTGVIHVERFCFGIVTGVGCDTSYLGAETAHRISFHLGWVFAFSSVYNG
jgi:hypothetical protein